MLITICPSQNVNVVLSALIDNDSNPSTDLSKTEAFQLKAITPYTYVRY